jgi:pimeloyl-ACP methyl ester carboxylesterase
VVLRLVIDALTLEARWWEPLVVTRTMEPIVLMHEGLGSVSMWRDFPAALARRTGRRVMAYSRFGHGRSDRPAQPHTVTFMHEEAALLPRILDEAQISRAVLFGHSDGGSIALVAAAQSPARATALVLEAPHVFVEDISVASIERTTASYEAGDLRARLARHHADVDAAFRGWSDVWLDPEFRAWNLEAFLPRIPCPTLLIQGEQDEYGTLKQVEAIARQVAHPVETLILPQCGHSPHRDQPEAVLEGVSRFLSTTRATP